MVAAALESFTATTFGGTTMHDYRDGDRVTHGLVVLRRGGHIIEPDLLFAAALREGWNGREALRLWKVAKEVAKGVEKRPKHRYRDGILEHWRAEGTTWGACHQPSHFTSPRNDETTSPVAQADMPARHTVSHH